MNQNWRLKQLALLPKLSTYRCYFNDSMTGYLSLQTIMLLQDILVSSHNHNDTIIIKQNLIIWLYITKQNKLYFHWNLLRPFFCTCPWFTKINRCNLNEKNEGWTQEFGNPVQSKTPTSGGQDPTWISLYHKRNYKYQPSKGWILQWHLSQIEFSSPDMCTQF